MNFQVLTFSPLVKYRGNNLLSQRISPKKHTKNHQKPQDVGFPTTLQKSTKMTSMTKKWQYSWHLTSTWLQTIRQKCGLKKGVTLKGWKKTEAWNEMDVFFQGNFCWRLKLKTNEAKMFKITLGRTTKIYLFLSHEDLKQKLSITMPSPSPPNILPLSNGDCSPPNCNNLTSTKPYHTKSPLRIYRILGETLFKLPFPLGYEYIYIYIHTSYTYI